MENVRRYALALVLLLLAASPLFAATAYVSACSADAIDNDTKASIGMAFSLIVFLIALAYMISNFMSIPQLSVWAKDEVAHLGLTLAIVLLATVVFATGCAASEGYAGGDPFSVSYKYLDGLADREGTSVVTSLTVNSLNNQLAATDYIFWGLPITGGGGQAPKADKKALSQSQEMAVDMAMPAIVSLKIQKLLLTLIESYGIKLLLPLAMLLRVLPFTREVGNFLLAVAFGIYVVFPLTYVMNAKAADSILPESVCPSGDPMCNDGVINYRSVGMIMPQAVLFPNISIVILVGTVMSVTKALNKVTSMMG